MTSTNIVMMILLGGGLLLVVAALLRGHVEQTDRLAQARQQETEAAALAQARQKETEAAASLTMIRAVLTVVLKHVDRETAEKILWDLRFVSANTDFRALLARIKSEIGGGRR